MDIEQQARVVGFLLLRLLTFPKILILIINITKYQCNKSHISYNLFIFFISGLAIQIHL